MGVTKRFEGLRLDFEYEIEYKSEYSNRVLGALDNLLSHLYLSLF